MMRLACALCFPSTASVAGFTQFEVHLKLMGSLRVYVSEGVTTPSVNEEERLSENTSEFTNVISKLKKKHRV